MPPAEKRDSSLTCSFCGKSQKEVKKLIAGPTVYICDECIGLCNDIIAEEIEKDEPGYGSGVIPKPAQSKSAPMDAAWPTQIVATAGLMCCMVS